MSPPPLSAARSTPTRRDSQDSIQPDPRPESHPFSKELEQVNEVAEEFGGWNLLDDEERILHEKGLKKFSVEEYLEEVQELWGSIFDDEAQSVHSPWF